MDSLGWTVITESADTRTVYVSNSLGNDSNDGFSELTPKKTIDAGKALLRNGFPDHLLLKRGDTFTNERLGDIGKSGRSADEPLLIGAYGNSTERPKLLTGSQHGIDDVSDIQHVAIVGLYFEPHTRTPNQQPANILRGESSDILFEDNYFTSYDTNLMVQGFDLGGGGRLADIRIRRNILVDAWSTTSHSQGIFAADIDGLLIEENVFDHNGWNESISGAEENIFNHNVYISGDPLDVTIRGNIFSAASSMGIKFQPLHGTHTISDNLFVQNAIGLQLGGGRPQEHPPITGINVTATGNVFLDGKNVGTLPHGFGVTMQNLNGGSFSNNIIANNGVNTGNPAISIHDGVSGWETQGYGVRDFVIDSNTIYNWRGSLDISEPTVGNPLPIIDNVTITNNTIKETSTTKALVQTYTADTSVTLFSGNKYSSNEASNQWFRLAGQDTSHADWVSNTGETGSSTNQVQFVDPNRSTSTYAASLGLAATHQAFMAEARKQSRLNWRTEYTTQAAVQYFRDGFQKVGASSPDNIGVQRDSQYFLDTSANRAWNGTSGGDDLFRFGTTSDTPLIGDWNGDGRDEIGVKRGNVWFLDVNGNGIWDSNTGGDRLVQFGAVNDVPIIGDWNGDGVDEIGVYRGDAWFLDVNGNGTWDGSTGGDSLVQFGALGDTPIVGDWNGDGIDDLGVHRGDKWLLDANGNHTWDGTGGGDVKAAFGAVGDSPIAGDWNGDGTDDIGSHRGNHWFLDTNGNHSWDGVAAGDSSFDFGAIGDVPLVGQWSAPAALMAQTTPSFSSQTYEPIAADALDAIVDQAISMWSASGVTAYQIDLLKGIDVRVADLNGLKLGTASHNEIVLDVNAAGHGWFVDQTPEKNEEFDLSSTEGLLAGNGNDAFNHMDLLTVVLHELGHTLGFAHDNDAGSIMNDTLDLGVRRLPTPQGVDAVFTLVE